MTDILLIKNFIFVEKKTLKLTISNVKEIFYIKFCEAQARVRQGSARDGSQGKRPQSLNLSLELTLNLVDPPSTRKSLNLKD